MSRPTATFHLGDTRAVVASLPTGSVDLILTSPPFLALRSYLPADHPDKASEIGSEPDPASFIDVMLDLTSEWRRVLAPHGSLAVEFGDTYSGHDNRGSTADDDSRDGGWRKIGSVRTGPGWPLAKSLTLVPELYRVALAYGRHPLTGMESPAGRWRVRNVVRWVRPNPPVGALGDKFRPATSDLVIACTASNRWFDLDAVRGEHKPHGGPAGGVSSLDGGSRMGQRFPGREENPAGAPPLDWWQIVPGGYSGKTATTRREPCGPADGGERTTSPGCPVHGGLPGQLPKALRDARAGAPSPHTPHTDDRPEHGQQLGFESTRATLAPSGSSGAPTSEMPDRECAPAANPHDTGSNRTAPAPSTNPLGTPSAGTPGRTGRTPASPESVAHRPDKPGSSTAPAGSDGSPESRTSAGTAGTATSPEASACSCTFHRVVTEYTSHYAVFPPELCVKPIEAMCPRRVCRTCGKPSRRETVGSEWERRPLPEEDVINRGGGGSHGDRCAQTTTGWSSCGCPGTDGIRLDGFHTGTGWRPGIVLDPFGGTGTTGMVATGHGRDAILIDLDARNADLARERMRTERRIVSEQRTVRQRGNWPRRPITTGARWETGDPIVKPKGGGKAPVGDQLHLLDLFGMA